MAKGRLDFGRGLIVAQLAVTLPLVAAAATVPAFRLAVLSPARGPMRWSAESWRGPASG